MFVSVQTPSAAQVEVLLSLHHNPSTGHCLTATLANRPLANYHHKDCQSNAGVSPNCTVTFLVANVGLEVDLLEWGAPLWRLVDICWNGEFNWWSNADLNLMCGELWLQTCVSEQNFFLETLRIWSDLVWICRWLLTFFKNLHLQSTRSTVKIVIFKSRSSKKLFNHN